MAKQRLTDKTLASSVSVNDIVHIVKTGDTSQNPAGSSYKATISQVVSTFTATSVTALTFNNISYDLTLGLDDGSSFTDNLGILASDIKVTGGTYNPATEEITFVNNSGGTFVVSGVSSTFTGNTSGTCITDLYVSNLYGCSPLTLQDSFQHNGSTASGTFSTAIGLGTTASGEYSHAEGQGSVASQEDAHAEGYFTTASGFDSHSEGFETTASGDGSHAEGGSTTASGEYSHSEGQATTASGNNGSHAEGSYTFAIGDASHAEGYTTSATTSYSHAEGSGTLASGTASHAEGADTIASGGNSHSEGLRTTASGNYSHAEGQSAIANGDTSHAEGISTTASGGASHAEGRETTASGNYSHSEGRSTTASGDYSHAGGTSTIASGNTSFVHFSGTFGSDYGVYADNSAILGGFNNNINSGATNSVILGGELNVISADVKRSVILGGQNITATTNDTLYTLNIDAQTGVFSSSSDNVLNVVGSGNSTSNPLFKVEGSSGELFSITDTLEGSLFSVNDISGLPILDVNSDSTIQMGSITAPSLFTTVLTTATGGTENIYSLPTSAYTGGFFDYTLVGNGGARAGVITSIWSGTTTQYQDVSTNDIGSSTSGVTFDVSVSGNDAILSVSAITGTYTIKTIVRSI